MELLSRPHASMTCLREPAYGYMKVPRDIEDEKVRLMEVRIRTFTQELGLEFRDFYYEYHCGSTAAFDEMIDELSRTGARYVIVPTLRHFAINELLRQIMVQRLEYAAGAQVFEVGYR